VTLPTVTVTVPPMGWGWLLLGFLFGWNLLELRHQAAMYTRARDSMEVLIQKGTNVWIAPEPKSPTGRPVDSVRLRARVGS